jgi:hypothetical protein
VGIDAYLDTRVVINTLTGRLAMEIEEAKAPPIIG